MSVRVRGHWRQGHWVHSHVRRSPRETSAGLGFLLLLVVAFALAGEPGDGRATPRPVVAKETASFDSANVVQIASDSSWAAAEARMRALASAGHPAGVLVSDDYRELRPGWFVTFLGPYPSNDAGKRSASEAAAAHADSIPRHLTRR